MSVLNFHELGDPSGEPVLAVHGITSHGLRFRRSAEQGWPDRRTIAVDLRGHGRSTYDGPWSIRQHVSDLVDTMDAVGMGDVDVVAHSYGAAIGLALLERARDRVRRFVMLDPALAQTGSWASGAALGTVAEDGWESVEAATIARNFGLGDEIHPAVTEDVAEHLIHGDDGRYRFRYHVPAVVTGWGEMSYPLPSSITPCPALLVIAEKAGLVTESTEVALTELFAGHLQTQRIDSGHMLYWERFEETVAAVTGFWSTT